VGGERAQRPLARVAAQRERRGEEQRRGEVEERLVAPGEGERQAPGERHAEEHRRESPFVNGHRADRNPLR
jgi:hypothetical protein